MSLSEGGNLLLCCDCQGTQTSDSVKNAAGWCFQSQKTQPESYPSFKIWLLEAHSSARDGRPVIVRFCLSWLSGHRLCAISLAPLWAEDEGTFWKNVGRPECSALSCSFPRSHPHTQPRAITRGTGGPGMQPWT